MSEKNLTMASLLHSLPRQSLDHGASSAPKWPGPDCHTGLRLRRKSLGSSIVDGAPAPVSPNRRLSSSWDDVQLCCQPRPKAVCGVAHDKGRQRTHIPWARGKKFEDIVNLTDPDTIYGPETPMEKGGSVMQAGCAVLSASDMGSTPKAEICDGRAGRPKSAARARGYRRWLPHRSVHARD